MKINKKKDLARGIELERTFIPADLAIARGARGSNRA